MERIASSLWVTLRRPKAMVTQSKWLSGKGSFSASAWTKLTLPETPFVEQLVAADLEHRGVDVGQHHLAGRADQARELPGQVAGAAGDVEHAVPAAHAGQLDGEALPQAMDATGHQVVHQVVLGCHRVKYLGDLLRLLAFRNVLVAEVGGGFGVGAFADRS